MVRVQSLGIGPNAGALATSLGLDVGLATKSVASATILPAVPTIREKQLSTAEPARLSEFSEALTSWNLSCKETQIPWTSVYTDPRVYQCRPANPCTYR